MRPEAALQAAGVPLSALATVIFGIMALSLPVGAYVVFSADIGGDIDHRYPLGGLDLFAAGVGFRVPADVELGDAFVALWCAYAAVFAAAALGPRRSFFSGLGSLMGGGGGGGSYMMAAVRWFSVLVLASAAIAAAQGALGIPAGPPPAGNDLLRFFEVTKAPLAEELGFRVALVGVPLYLAYARRASPLHFLSAMWHPHRALRPPGPRLAAAVIALSGALFGIAHVVSGEPWGAGKAAQATAAGVIIGWAYYRHGLAAALLVHWASNYVVFSYAHLVASASGSTLEAAFSHSMMHTFEAVFVAAGCAAVAMMAARAAARRAARGRATS